jgi:hypothetical protein
MVWDRLLSVSFAVLKPMGSMLMRGVETDVRLFCSCRWFWWLTALVVVYGIVGNALVVVAAAVACCS